MRSAIVGLSAGFIFGLGLAISGMTDPDRILAFLDVAGVWNPSLAFVMVAAIAVAAPAFAYARRRGKTLFGVQLSLPPRYVFTPSLVLGSAAFGIGWGLSGFCPGPAVVALATGDYRIWLFVLALMAGWLLADAALNRSGNSAST
jgi:uncharacterized protein